MDADEHVKELVKKRLAIMESFIALYFHNTGAKIEDTVLCEQYCDDGVIRYWLEPKGRR